MFTAELITIANQWKQPKHPVTDEIINKMWYIHTMGSYSALKRKGFLTSATIRCCCCLVSKSCLTLCDPMDYSLPNSSVHGIFQARIPEWVAVFFSRGSSLPRDGTPVFSTADRLYHLSHQGSPLTKTS